MVELMNEGVPRFVMRDLDVNFDPFEAQHARFARPSARIAASRTHLCHQPLSAEVDVGQRQRGERARGVLGQPAVAHLGNPSSTLAARKLLIRLDRGSKAQTTKVSSRGQRVLAQANAGRRTGTSAPV